GSAGVCALPADVGLCRASFERFHYNAKTGTCEKFIWGGCGGNDNNFETEQQCKDKC
ncbi:hypothetical protein VOLCADRAFT_39402, partial [Volvox carteri f. nagariensis]